MRRIFLRVLLPLGLLLVAAHGGMALLMARGAPPVGQADPKPQAPQTQDPARQTEPAKPGQQPAAQQPVFRAEINFVRVDVIVTDKQGRPVGDLTQKDFEILEDGKPQTVESFKLVQITPGGQIAADGAPPIQIRNQYDEEKEAAREDARLIAIFLDDYHVRRGNSMRVRQPIAEFVQKQLDPADLVGVMTPLMPIEEFHFTRNRDAIADALNNFWGVKYIYSPPRNQFEERYSHLPVEQVERIRAEVSFSALKALFIHLGALREGRKAVVLVSEGFSLYVPPSLNSPVADFPLGRGRAGDAPPGSAQEANEQRAQFFSDADVQSYLREVYDYANRNNVSIYTLDPRGLAAFESDIDEGVSMKTDAAMLTSTQDTLRVLADQTDGRAIVNRNDLAGGLKQIVTDSSAYYLLGYNSSNGKADGKFRRIDVRVKRPGVTVRFRKGYFSPTQQDIETASSPKKAGPPSDVQAALSALAAPKLGRSVATSVATSRGPQGKTRVTIGWEPRAKPGGPVVAAILLTVVNGAGDVMFRERSGPPSQGGGAGGPAAARDPRPFAFDLPPGSYQAKMTYEDASGQVVDTDYRPIEVPDLHVASGFSTPQLWRATMPREVAAIDRGEVSPAIQREFRRTDRLIIGVSLYQSDPGASVTMQVLNRTGQPLGQIPTRLVPLPAGGDPMLRGEVALASFPPGEYLIAVEQAAIEGKPGKREIVAFRLVP